MQPEFYEAILERLQKDYSLTIDRSEHPAITEFYEGPLPLFKLIMTSMEEGQPSVLIVSFHIQLDTAIAIQWFLRIRHLDPNLHISACYIKDTEGVSYVGEDAEIMLMYMVEQDVISAWLASNKEDDEILNEGLPKPVPSPAKVYNNYKKAIAEFHRLKKNKGDISH